MWWKEEGGTRVSCHFRREVPGWPYHILQKIRINHTVPGVSNKIGRTSFLWQVNQMKKKHLK